MLSCTKFRSDLSWLKIIPCTISRSTRIVAQNFLPLPVSYHVRICTKQLDQVRFTMTYHSGFPNTSCKCISQTKSICLKNVVVTGALLRNSVIDSRRATTIIFGYTLDSYPFSKTYPSEQLNVSFMHYHIDKPKWLGISLNESKIAFNFDISVFITLSNIWDKAFFENSLVKAVNCFCKTLHLICLTKLWIHLCSFRAYNTLLRLAQIF